MSIERIKRVVTKYVSDKHNDMLVIKGGWGVGKTYFWEQLLREASNTESISKDYYAYISLFGINSLEELKNTIFAARVSSKTMGSVNSNKEWFSGVKALFKQAEQIPALREWTGGMVSTALFLSLRDTLICFDDIERKGNDLDIKDILGIASLLKEQRNCKLVLIMNDGTLDQDEMQEFRRHSEKAIDIELRFSPTSEEASSYVISADHLYYDLMKSCCSILRIKNIRIIQRIYRFVEDLIPIIKDAEPDVSREIIKTLILCSWVYYDRDGNVPTLEYVRSYTLFDSLLHKRKDESSEQEKRWVSILNSYDYRGVDEILVILSSFIETGYLDAEALLLEVEKKNIQARAQQGQDTYQRIWSLYHGSFDNNEQEFINGLATGFRANMKYLTLANLQSTTEILRGLDQNQLADTLIDEYMLQLTVDLSEVDMSTITFMNHIKDEVIKNRVKDFRESAKKKRSFSEIIKKLSAQNGWNQEDVEILASAEVEDFYNFFKSERSESLYLYVKACLQFVGLVDRAEYVAIGTKVKEALKRIAAESRINRVRVKWLFDIDIDQDEQN